MPKFCTIIFATLLVKGLKKDSCQVFRLAVSQNWWHSPFRLSKASLHSIKKNILSMNQNRLATSAVRTNFFLLKCAKLFNTLFTQKFVSELIKNWKLNKAKIKCIESAANRFTIIL